MCRGYLTLIFCLCLLFTTTCAWAKEPESPELTFQRALEMAKSNSETLKSADYDIERSYTMRDEASDDVKYTPLEPSTTAAERAFTALQQADLNWRMAKRTATTQEDTLVMQTHQLYNGLLQAKQNVAVLEAQLKNAEWQRTVAAAQSRVGLLNKMGLLQAENSVEAAKTGLEAANKSLDDTYQKFNQLVGLWPVDRPVLVDRPNYEELNVSNLDYEVQRAAEESPTIWLAEKKVDLAQMTLDIYNYTDSSAEPYSVKEIDYDKAKLSAASTDEQVRKLVRTIYYSVKQLEEQYAAVQSSIGVAEEALRVVKVKYDVGMAILPEVYAAEVTLLKAKQSLLDLTCQHEILTYAFYKPWAYSGS